MGVKMGTGCVVPILRPFCTTHDGRRFLVRATPEHGAPQPLTVIVNWPALLKEGKR
jgi:hypothetical protein